MIAWDKLKEQFPVELGRSLAFFDGITIEDTRDCLLACLRGLVDDQAARDFEAQFRRTEILWEAISPDESLYPHSRAYFWLCGMYIAHRRRSHRAQATHEELAAKTRDLIGDYTTFMKIAEDIPVYKIDANYLTRVQELTSPADRAAELEAALNAELAEGGGFLYRKLGERLKHVVADKETDDAAAIRHLQELQGLVEEINRTKAEPARLGLTEPGEYPLFTVIRAFADDKNEATCVRAAKAMMTDLRRKRLLPAGWADNQGGRQPVALALQVASWEPEFHRLALCPPIDFDPPFLAAAVEELARTVG